MKENGLHRTAPRSITLAVLLLIVVTTLVAAADKYEYPSDSALPPSDMKLKLDRTALVITDPQIDFLSPKGVSWGLVGNSVTELNTVENLGRLFQAAKDAGIVVAISPHYYFPGDHGWKFEGALEKAMHGMGMFDRPTRPGRRS